MDIDLTVLLSTPKGFLKRYMHHLTNDHDLTQLQAYETTEKEYQEIFKRRRYSCYNSFRHTKNRLIRIMD